MWIRTPVIMVFLGCLGPRLAQAKLVIDDFSVSPIVVNGPNTVVQSQLPQASVVGGKRIIEATRLGDRVEVLMDGGLQYASSSGYGMKLVYGDGQFALIDNPSVHGDRLSLNFSDSASPAARLAYVFIDVLPSSSRFQLRFYDELRVLGDEGFIEFLLDELPVAVTSITRIEIDFARAWPTGGFVLREVAIVDPPLPGDYDRNGTVDVIDYEKWRQQFGRVSSNAIITADGSVDHVVNGADYTIWRKNYSGGSLAKIDNLRVPEASAAWLVGLCCLVVGLAANRWARNR